MILNARTSTLKSRQNFDYYYLSNNFNLALLSEPDCFAIGDYGNESWQIPVQGLLSSTKLDYYNKKNFDLDCIQNYDFLYSLEIRDTSSDNKWDIGLQNIDSSIYEREIRIPFFVSIMYNNDPANITTGKSILTSYIGEIPRFYGEIKKSCNFGFDENYRINTHNVISYKNANNKFCIGEYCFYPSFSCKVNDFIIPKGKHLVRLNYKKGNLTIII
jgi:hypothetical protein